MLPAARAGDLIVSTATKGLPLPIIPPTATTVLIGGMPAARVGDSCGADIILNGSTTVFIEGIPAARMGDSTAAGGAILPPCAPNVLIGA